MADEILFAAGVDHHFTGWSVDGDAGNIITIDSDDHSTAHNLIADSGGPFASDWLSISHSHATPADQWTAQANCVDVTDNTGWFATSSVSVFGTSILPSFSLTGVMGLDLSIGGSCSISAPIAGIVVQLQSGTITFIALQTLTQEGISELIATLVSGSEVLVNVSAYSSAEIETLTEILIPQLRDAGHIILTSGSAGDVPIGVAEVVGGSDIESSGNGNILLNLDVTGVNDLDAGTGTNVPIGTLEIEGGSDSTSGGNGNVLLDPDVTGVNDLDVGTLGNVPVTPQVAGEIASNITSGGNIPVEVPEVSGVLGTNNGISSTIEVPRILEVEGFAEASNQIRATVILPSFTVDGLAPNVLVTTLPILIFEVITLLPPCAYSAIHLPSCTQGPEEF